MEKELVLEGLISAAGYDDAIVTVSGDNLNVIVKTNGFTGDDAARILTIVVDETKMRAANIKIVPVA